MGAPLRQPVFRRIWTASLFSNLGQQVQAVAAAWTMLQITHAPHLVAMVQTASMMPIMLLAIAAGAIADMYDRRKVAMAALCLSFSGALQASLAVLLTLGDPGLTIDEPLDVRPGRTYVAALRAEGLGFFARPVVDRVFRDNAEHPPLGRWLLGWASTVGQPFETVIQGGPDPVGVYVRSGRVAPALAFAALVGLVVQVSTRRHGAVAGAVAGFALLALWILVAIAQVVRQRRRRPRPEEHAHSSADV